MAQKSKYNLPDKKKESSSFLSHELLSWYDKHRRDLPWRVPVGSQADAVPDPYHVLLSEAMLQQTQVATVIPYFHRFLSQFPTVSSLADSDEQAVLKLWQGLGYYSRARNLRRAAMQIVHEHAGIIPSDLISLQKLPGIGRYTAGAISSIAYNARSPIVDGNVIRVLSRIDGIREDPRDKSVLTRIWMRAEEILPKNRTGDFNSALMELGATVCTPRSPACDRCPVRKGCIAFKENLQNVIPPAKKQIEQKIEKRSVFCIQDKQDRYLMQQRPATGRWAGMWQFYTQSSKELSFKISNLKLLTTIKHTLTHRKYQFDVFTGQLIGKSKPIEGAIWLTLEECHKLPLPKPHVMILQQLG